MSGDAVESEAVVGAAFHRWLEADGWEVDAEAEWVDVVARRADTVLVAVVTGADGAPDAGVDAAYGQILRRMDPDAGAGYAIVVPETASAAALSVPAKVRGLLDLTVYAVSGDGAVTEIS